MHIETTQQSKPRPIPAGVVVGFVALLFLLAGCESDDATADAIGSAPAHPTTDIEAPEPGSAASEAAQPPSTQPPPDRYDRIMFIGDSITRGYPDGNSWRYYVGRNLAEHDAGIDVVGATSLEEPGAGPFFEQPWDSDHNAFAGLPATFYIDCVAVCASQCADPANTVCESRQVRAAVSQLSEFDPDVVVAMLGSIDLTWSNDVTPSTVVNSLRKLVLEGQHLNADLDFLLPQITPLSPTYYSGDEVKAGYEAASTKIDAANAELVTLARELTTDRSQVVVIDATVGLDLNNDFVDGIHFDPTGSQVVGRNISRALFQEFGIGGEFSVANPCDAAVCADPAALG